MAQKVDVDAEFEKLVQKGNLLGLDGSELLAYVDKQEREQRDRLERQRDREEKRLLEEREREEKKLQAEANRVLEERRIEAELEKERLKVLLNLERAKISSASNPPYTSLNVLKLPTH